MLPLDLATFSFQPETRVTDDELANRIEAASPGPRVLVFGCVRLGLVESLIDRRLDVVVVDSSRRALLRAEVALADGGRSGNATLLAQDPRELEIPDGADAIVLPSIAWRAVVARDRADILGAFAKTLRSGGVLCLDLERVEAPSIDGVTEVARGDAVPVRLSSASPEVLLDEARLAGLAVRRIEPIGTATPPRCVFAVAAHKP